MWDRGGRRWGGSGVGGGVGKAGVRSGVGRFWVGLVALAGVGGVLGEPGLGGGGGGGAGEGEWLRGVGCFWGGAGRAGGGGWGGPGAGLGRGGGGGGGRGRILQNRVVRNSGRRRPGTRRDGDDAGREDGGVLPAGRHLHGGESAGRPGVEKEAAVYALGDGIGRYVGIGAAGRLAVRRATWGSNET